MGRNHLGCAKEDGDILDTHMPRAEFFVVLGVSVQNE